MAARAAASGTDARRPAGVRVRRRCSRLSPPVDVGAQRVPRIVGDEPAPDERPQRVDGFAGKPPPDRFVNRAEERRALRLQERQNLLFALAEGSATARLGPLAPALSP